MRSNRNEWLIAVIIVSCSVLAAQDISGPTAVVLNGDGSYSTTLGASDLECPLDNDANPLTPSSTITYTWTYPDGTTYSTTDASEVVSYTFASTGTYTIQVDLSAPVAESGHEGVNCTATAAINVSVFSVSLSSTYSQLYAGGITNDDGGHQTAVKATTSEAVSGISIDFRIKSGSPFISIQAGLATSLSASGSTSLSATTDSSGDATVYFTSSDSEGTVTIEGKASDDTTWTTTDIVQVVFDTVTTVD